MWKPLLVVEALLSVPEIFLYPHTKELVKLLMAAMRKVVETGEVGIGKNGFFGIGVC